MAQQFLLRGSSLEQLTREAVELYGAEARVVRAERVLDAGLAGFLGRRHLEVTVQVPEPGEGVGRAAPPARHVLSTRAGIAALLETADTIEDDVNLAGAEVAAAPAAPAVSTESGTFAQLLTRLGDDVRPARVPVTLSSPGDLVLVMGLEDTARAVTSSMARQTAPAGGNGWTLYGAGPVRLSDRPHIEGWWDAIRARAMAVDEGTALLAAFALGPVSGGLPHLEAAAAVGADQTWLVVDARHKADETSDWVERVRESVRVDALAVTGAAETRSAATVNRLRIPLGWLDERPAPRTVL